MITPDASAAPLQNDSTQGWWRELTRYQWLVLVVAIFGWLFDTMDQQLFNLARSPAIKDLHGSKEFQWYAGLTTAIFMLGWATGGIIFGILGDRLGRARTLTLTILLYSLFTGLSALSQSLWDFTFYRFLTGLGVGGEFAVGISLVAEVMPERARPHALGWLQACSAFGNISAALISMGLGTLEGFKVLGGLQVWRVMFLVGAVPAFLAIFIVRRLKEPERWTAMRAQKDVKLGSVAELFSTPRWRRNAIAGLVLAISGVVGLWGIGFFGFDLVRAVFHQTYEKEAIAQGGDQLDREFVQYLLKHPAELPASKKAVPSADALVSPQAKRLYGAILQLADAGATISTESAVETATRSQESLPISDRFAREQLLDFLAPAPVGSSPTNLSERIADRRMEIDGRLTNVSGIYGLLFNVGAFFGVHLFSKMAQFMGRRPAFAISFIAALVTTAYSFWFLETYWDVFWMVPIMGFFQLSIFGGYAIYFPELFPTRLRSTGISFCYNVGRYLAAGGPLLLGTLAAQVFGSHGVTMSWRLAGVCMCSFFLLGLAALPFAPETRGQPLPE